MKVITKLTVFIFIALFSISGQSFAQSGIDNAGREFYFAFMPNWHENNSKDDLLFVFISSKTPTKGKIEYTNRFNVTSSVDFTITDPNIVKSISFDPSMFELLGQNNSGRILNSGGDTEQIKKTTFHLTSDDDVTVVIHNEARYTSDACLVYPVDALGRNYFVFSYESNFYISFPSNLSTPSQFIVVGTEDNTKVTIEPTTNTLRNGKDTQNIVLNKGEVYLVQADVTNYNTTDPKSDLTGTRVKTDKKVAVFGGHQRANIPFTEYASRDYLLSQMIPLEAWGRDVFIVPFFQPGSIDNKDNDITKITVAYDDTQIYFAGVPFTKLNRGEKITQPITEPIYVTADKPIRASLYKKSSQATNSQNGAITSSDPFMVLFPPKGQFLRSYKFINVDLPKNYNDHFVNIIVPTVSRNSLRLDNKPIVGTFLPIKGIDYSYANIGVSGGSHYITADTNFGICVYGYGQTNSYGYVGGLGLEELDWTPPEFTSTPLDCDKLSFGYSELNRKDSGLDSVIVTSISNLNYFVVDSTKSNYSARIELKDKYQDGFLSIYAIDSAGSVTRDTSIIEGFTFTLSQNNMYEFTMIQDTVRFDTTNCTTLTIKNYGIVAKDISKLKLKNGTLIELVSNQTILEPGESTDIYVCFVSGFESGWFTDTLELESGCYTEEMGSVAFYLRPDSNKPSTSTTLRDCGDALLSANELIETDYGFGEYEIINTNNLDINVEVQNEREISLYLSLKDKYIDGQYEIKFQDRAGNDTIVYGIVQGFTAAFISDLSGDLISFNLQTIGGSKCMDIMIENYGLLPITIERIELSEKLNFFIPQSQLPFTVPADTALPFKVCFFGNAPSKELLNDEMRMLFDCNEKMVKLDGETKEIIIKANSKCDYELLISIDDVPKSLSIDNIYPNPVVDQLSMQLSIDKDRPIKIDLINELGVSYEVMNEPMGEGVYDFRVDMSDIPTGSYILQIISEENRLSQKVVITK
ncbi:MAG: T9SS type A sorting domain-containing protein [Candidatus Kapaibacterium sp.]